ncbi:Pentatricopeptide repeat-containing protein [Thalictrum thalictroides]|uniref:Pentatricopeptide repeat-containing protein n=1 Tax=Thalictrum thalictroides TaxID=46969 RepID=A0A7J6WCW8_THATH|nr:Pentatricopeptide repeat-containing protein [Thalictrum thalictroides]
MPEKNCFTWNSLIEAYLKSGNKDNSLDLFKSMLHKNEFSWNMVVSSFAKSGDVRRARVLFDEMPMKNGVVWNAMIHGYASNGDPEEALRLYIDLNLCRHETAKTDSFILASVVGVCANMGALDCGKQIHTWIVVNNVDFDSVLLSSLINMYVKCGDLDNAICVFNSLQQQDNFSLSALISGYAKCGRLDEARKLFDSCIPCVGLWNSMLAGYVANNQVDNALGLFNRMQKDGVQADTSTFASILSGCASMSDLKNGKQAHSYAYKLGVSHDLIVASVTIDMYAKCGCSDDACKFFSELEEHDVVLLNSMINLYFSNRRIKDAKHVFETMPGRSLITWNSMIVGYTHNGFPFEALNLFCEMHRLDLRTDTVSLASVISACASISSLRLGEQIFARATAIGLDSDQIISTSLIDLYCKCGSVKDGRRLFNEMMKADEVPWNTMLMGYSTNGYGTEALNLFDEMRHAGVSPNDITFTGVLSACNHNGLVEEGQRCFYAMKSDFKIEPGMEHYSCMIDLCSRAGFLDEAMDLIDSMPFEADVSMWLSILRGCATHGNENLGRKVAEHIIQLDPENSSAYVQLASIHATRGHWERSEEVRKMMHGNRIRKNPGCSWIEIEQQVKQIATL